MEQIDNSKLKELLESRNHITDDNEMRQVMNQIFTIIVEETRLLSPVVYSETPHQNSDGTLTLKKGTKISFPMLSTPDKKHFYPVFTDMDELKKGEHNDVGPIAQSLSFDDYARLIIDMKGADGLVVDPFGANLLIVKEQVELFRKIKQEKYKQMANTENVLAKSGEDDVKIGEPTFYPDDLVEAISEYAKTQENINAIWLFLMERNEERSYLLVVDYTGDEDSTYKGIVESARPYLDDMYLDIMPYDGEFGKNTTKDKEPFYKK